MKTLRLNIEGCNECPYLWYDDWEYTEGWFCFDAVGDRDKSIRKELGSWHAENKPTIIPADCPLPDAEDSSDK